jgi:hypothetical protein
MVSKWERETETERGESAQLQESQQTKLGNQSQLERGVEVKGRKRRFI